MTGNSGCGRIFLFLSFLFSLNFHSNNLLLLLLLLLHRSDDQNFPDAVCGRQPATLCVRWRRRPVQGLFFFVFFFFFLKNSFRPLKAKIYFFFLILYFCWFSFHRSTSYKSTINHPSHPPRKMRPTTLNARIHAHRRFVSNV